ncbi:MAG: putative lipid II flippase FtsW [Candidatus Marinimicrobia bacterium]|nr:putative lipid II flippase FtsW [Candidatus Neomarinimicrobiota bacterium]|tara:strand:- start:13951 stop:15105 length:1155 start_codon:yes stop_codon:yes gene_type:complete
MNHLNIVKKHIDHILLGQILLITAIGMVMLYSASSAQSINLTSGESNSIYFTAHIKRLIIALGLMTGFILYDYRKFKRIALYLVGISFALLIISLIIKFVSGSNFPGRWIHIGPLTFQPSDFARLSMIIYLAAYLDINQRKITDFTYGLFTPISILALICTLIVLQPDFSTAMVIGCIGFVILFVGGAKISHLAACGSIAMIISVPVMMLKSYRLQRVIAWLNQDDSSISTNYQAAQSLISLGNGGLFGMGLGESIQKDQFLPTPHTDFIFAIIGEETGFLGCMILIFLFILVYRRIIKIARECTDPFGIFLSVGIGFNLIFYTFINIAVVTGILPVTGLQIPMVSYGGSGLVITLSSIGILLNISQRKRSLVIAERKTRKMYG